MKRRQFAQQLAHTTLALPFLPAVSSIPWRNADLHVSCNLYTWYSYYNREGNDFYADMDAGLAAVSASGVDGIEPSLSATAQVDGIAPLLEKYGLAMRSIYVGTQLHERDEVQASIDTVLAIAERCKPLGTTLLVTNPNPIAWGSGEIKTDAQLRVQADALDRLGAAVREMGLTLAYHTHDSEFRAGAREFHHMMLATDPQNVTFCLDVHWVYRGALNSNVALYDVIDMYHDRITELHIRQSSDHIWTETFGEGDIDYARVVNALKQKGVQPLLVLEQAAEEGTPRTMSPLEAHRVSQQQLREVFAPLG